MRDRRANGKQQRAESVLMNFGYCENVWIAAKIYFSSLWIVAKSYCETFSKLPQCPILHHFQA